MEYGDLNYTTAKINELLDVVASGIIEYANQLKNSYTINSTAFNGTKNIVTSIWGTTRTFYVQDYYGTYRGSAVSVNGGGDVNLRLPSTIKAEMIHVVGTGGAESYIKSDSEYNMYFVVDGITPLVLDGNSKVLRSGASQGGTIDFGSEAVPWGKGFFKGFMISDTASMSENYSLVARPNSSNPYWGMYYNGKRWYIQGYDGMLQIGNGTATSVKLDTSGNLKVPGSVTPNYASDIRLKSLTGKKIDFIQRLMELGKVVEYTYNDLAIQRGMNAVDKGTHIGLIYQDVKDKLPQMASVSEDGYGTLNYISPDYINLIAGALQQVIKEIIQIKKRLKG